MSFAEIQSWITENTGMELASADVLLAKYILPAVIALVGLIVSYFVAKFAARVISSPVQSRVDETLGRFVGKMTFYSVMLCCSLGILDRVGMSITGFAAVLAAAGFAIGLAFQGTLGNFASGILLLVFRPFKVGDVVNAAGVTARVFEIDLFTTVLDTMDNRRIIVPNSSITSGTIENVTYHKQRRVEVPVGIEYSACIDKTRQVLTQAAESLQDRMIDGKDRGYQVVLLGLGSSSVDWVVRFWAPASEFFPTKEALTRAIKQHLDQAGISIPFPQMDIHFDSAQTNESQFDSMVERIRPRMRRAG